MCHCPNVSNWLPISISMITLKIYSIIIISRSMCVFQCPVSAKLMLLTFIRKSRAAKTFLVLCQLLINSIGITLVCGIFIADPESGCMNQLTWRGNLSNATTWYHRGNWIVRGHASNRRPGHAGLWRWRLHHFVWCHQGLCLPDQANRKGLFTKQSKLIAGRHWVLW